jgi:hypothetical protein
LFFILAIRRALDFSENLNNVGHLQKKVLQSKTWSWGRRLAWNKLSLTISKTIWVAMYLSHFSANSSLFSFFGKSLLKHSLAEGEKNERRQHSQVPWMWKHKELERWKTLSPIWRDSAIFLQRLHSQVFRSLLVSQTFSFFLCSSLEVS